MKETIFLLKEDKQLVEMAEAQYLTEDELQTLLEDYPDLISGDQIDQDNPRRWVLVCREMGVADGENAAGRWSLDHLFIDQDGIPTLIEVKRSTDTRIRREVIGQILDYAANAVSYWSVDEIKNQFEQTCQQKNKDANEVLLELLQGDQAAVANYWEVVSTNLKAGKIRLLLVADVIPREMKRIIEFLNEQMNTCTILGVEIKQFTGPNVKTLVPRVIGATTKAQSQKTARATGGERWDEERFFEYVKQKDNVHYQLYEKIYKASANIFDSISWGTGSKTASFTPKLFVNGLTFQLFAIYVYSGSSTIEIQFQYLKSRKPFDDIEKRNQLQDKLNSTLNANFGNAEQRPNIKVEVFDAPGVLSAFFEVVRWFIEEVRDYYKVNP